MTEWCALANRRLQPLGHVSGVGYQALAGGTGKYKWGIATQMPPKLPGHLRRFPSPGRPFHLMVPSADFGIAAVAPLDLRYLVIDAPQHVAVVLQK